MDLNHLESLLLELAKTTKRGKVNAKAIHELVQAVSTTAHELITAKQYEPAISVLERARSVLPDDPTLKRISALAYGAKGEAAMEMADRLGLVLSKSKLRLLEVLFQQAIDIDPTVPDPHWDMAVIQGRYLRKFNKSLQYFNKAKNMGYVHPMMPVLENLIQQGLDGKKAEQRNRRVSFEKGESKLKELIWALLVWPDQLADSITLETMNQANYFAEPVFYSYCHKAMNLVNDGKLSLNAFKRVQESVTVSTTGDNAEYAADLLRNVAEQFDDLNVLAEATNRHLRILADSSFALRSRADKGQKWLKRARNAASRGLRIAKKATIEVDPNIHADLLVAFGQTFTHKSDYHLAEALKYYLQALDLKEAARKQPDINKLKYLIRRMASYAVQMMIAATSGLGSIGTALNDLEMSYKAVQRLGEKALIAEIGIALAKAYSAVRQPTNGEAILRETLKLPGINESKKIEALFQLASSLSESQRAKEALAIQEDLLTHAAKVFRVLDPAVFWLNIGNSRREVGELEAAREAFKNGLKTVKPYKKNELPVLKAQITAMLAQTEFMLGHSKQGQTLLRQAEKIFAHVPGVTALHFHALAARLYFDKGLRKSAHSHLGRAQHLLRYNLSKGPSLPVWESMLQEWSHLDAYRVEGLLTSRQKDARRKALIAAENAKGRILAWLRNYHDPKAAAAALQDDRQIEALDKVQEWIEKGSGRLVLSLFASPSGLAVFGIGPGRCLDTSWLSEVQYDAFRRDYYEVWESQIDKAMSGDPGEWQTASMLTDLLLERLGEWLWRALPNLAKGGEDLVIVPHRLFRSLPLTYAKIPGGRRLSDLFHRVVISPSLYDLAQNLEKTIPKSGKTTITALVDPDGTLPFARVEGIHAAGHKNTKTSANVTAASLLEAITSPGFVLISAHGDFIESNPWRSVIKASDMPLGAAEIVIGTLKTAADVAILGVCEAGKTRRSVSDEPLGFPSLLVQGGVSTVVAPMWKVDDFASLIFMTYLFARIQDRVPVSQAVVTTARWMQELRPKETIDYLNSILQKLQRMNAAAVDEALLNIQPKLLSTRRWLEKLSAQQKPFKSPLDWAAFQVIGVPR